MAKQPWDELSKDPTLEEILLRDPMERIKRIEARLAGLDQTAREIASYHTPELDYVQSIGDWMWGTDCEAGLLDSRIDVLTIHCEWKRDNCNHYNGDICDEWSWDEKIPEWSMTKQDDKWKLCVSKDSEYCATCPSFSRKITRVA